MFFLSFFLSFFLNLFLSLSLSLSLLLLSFFLTFCLNLPISPMDSLISLILYYFFYTLFSNLPLIVLTYLHNWSWASRSFSHDRIDSERRQKFIVIFSRNFLILSSERHFDEKLSFFYKVIKRETLLCLGNCWANEKVFLSLVVRFEHSLNYSGVKIDKKPNANFSMALCVTMRILLGNFRSCLKKGLIFSLII